VQVLARQGSDRPPSGLSFVPFCAVGVAEGEVRALWKALITMTETESPQYETQAHTLVELLEEPVGT